MSFQTISVPTLSDPEHFSGSSAVVLVEPGDGGSALAGTQAVGRYLKTRDGVLIPTDFTTMQAAAAYAHQERLHDLDEKAGAGSLLSWPLSIGVQVKLMSYGQIASNNAVYDAKLNSLLLVPYNMGALPIPLNGGILAHEHFHFIFQKLVMSHVHDAESQTNCQSGVVILTSAPASDSDSNSNSSRGGTSPEGSQRSELGAWNETQAQKTAAAIPPRVYNSYVLRGMNEGFADFWGWLYSQDDSFLARSIPDQDEYRKLDSDAGRLPNESLVRRLLVDMPLHPDRIIPEITRAHNAYSLGTVYARYLRSLARELTKSGRSMDEAKFLVARALIDALPSLAKSVDASYETGFIDPNAVLEPLMAALPSLSADVCRDLEMVRAFQVGYKKPVSCQGFDIPVGGTK